MIDEICVRATVTELPTYLSDLQSCPDYNGRCSTKTLPLRAAPRTPRWHAGSVLGIGLGLG